MSSAARNKFSAIILDHRLDNISGLKIRRRIRIYDRETPIIFYSLSAYGEIAKQASPPRGNAYPIRSADLSHISENVKKLISAREGFSRTEK